MITILVILAIAYYSYKTHRCYRTTHSEGHHKWAQSYEYDRLKTGEHLRLNDDWKARGVETCAGWIGWGSIHCTNSFRRDCTFKYVSLMIDFPYLFEVGIEVGFVTGYYGYKKGIAFGDQLFGICPKMRWRDPVNRSKFISVRQFGSASITTTGVVERLT